MSTAIAARSSIHLRRPTRDRKAWAGDVTVFLIAASCAFTVAVGGQLLYGEIFFLFLLPFFILTRPQAIFRKEYRTIYLLLAVWLFSQIITDIYVAAPLLDRLKGIARVAFFALDVACLSALIGTSLRRIVIFALGQTMFAILALHGQGGTPFPTLWKMNIGPTLSALLLLLASPLYVRRKYGWVILILLGLAAANLRYGVRSQVLVDLVAVLFLLPIFPKASRSVHMPSGVRIARFAVLLALAAAAAWTSESLIDWATNSGVYSQAEQEKFEGQSAGKYGMIFGGRPEGPVAIQAIRDSPILGHGSYAVDPKYLIMLQDYQYKWGYVGGDEEINANDPEIPTHSHLTMAWVEGGVLASLFWFYMLGLVGRSVVRLTEISHPLTPFYLYILIGLAWDILFSPFGQVRRMFEAFLIVIMVNLLRKSAAQGGGAIKRRFGERRAPLRKRVIWNREGLGPSMPRRRWVRP